MTTVDELCDDCAISALARSQSADHDAGIERDFTPEVRHELLELMAGFRQTYTHGSPTETTPRSTTTAKMATSSSRPRAEPPSRRSGVVAALTPSTPEDRLAT